MTLNYCDSLQLLVFYVCQKKFKITYCFILFKSLFIFILENYDGTIVFVEQKRNADYIAAYLCEQDYPTTSIHGDREQPERELAIKDFKTKRMKILVATAVAARGLGV